MSAWQAKQQSLDGVRVALDLNNSQIKRVGMVGSRRSSQKDSESSRVSYRSNTTTLRLTQGNLQKLQSNIGSLHETDIFKICVKTLQPSQLAQIMPPLANVTLQLDSDKTKILVYKLFTRIWSAYTKTLIKQVQHRGKTVVCPVFGIFSPLQNFSEESNANRDQSLSYIPSQLLQSLDIIKYEPKRPFNLPFSPLD